MISRKKRIFLFVVLMFEMIFLANHWNDYVFTPMNPNEIEEIHLEIHWYLSDTLFVTIYKKESIQAIVETEDLLRKNDNTCVLIKTAVYLINISYVLNSGEIITRSYQEQLIHSELERAFLKVEEIKKAVERSPSP